MQTRQEGVLPKSIMIVGKAYQFKELLKDRFDQIRYKDLIFSGGKVTKCAWVLPCNAQTESTGTLANYLKGLGVKVTEIDLDEDEDEDDDAEPDEEGMIDEEAAVCSVV